MSDEAEKLREQLAARTAYANGLLSSWQAADIENRKLVEERKRLWDRVEELGKKLSRAEGRLADRERDHYVLMDAFRLLTRAHFDGADLIDKIDAAVEIGDPPSQMKEWLAEYHAQVRQAQNATSDHYARQAQERLLLKIFKYGMTPETRLELRRFLESRMEYFRDADHWQEAFELLVAEDKKEQDG